MSNELSVDYITGKNVYFQVRNSVNDIWNTAGGVFETYNAANVADYDIAGTEQGASGYYVGSMPAVAAGSYNVLAKERGGGSPAETDISVGWGTVQWGGTVVTVVPPSGLGVNVASGNLTNVYSGQMSGQLVSVASGLFTFASLNSGQSVLVYSGQLSGQQVGVSSGTLFPASGSTQIASGPFVVGSLLSGQVVGVYSGNLSGQFVNVFSGDVHLASGTFGTSGFAEALLTFDASGITSGRIPVVSLGSVALKLASRFNARSGTTYLPDGTSVHMRQTPVNGSGMTPIAELGVGTQ